MTSQIIVNIAISSSIFLLIALSFSLIYEVTRFFHFAHAVVFTSGAYFAFLFHIMLGLPLYLAIPLACMSACLIGCMMEWFVYKPLRKRGATSIILLLASLGLYIVLQNLISMMFGDDTKSIRTWPVVAGREVLGARITDVQIIIIVASIVLVVLVAGFLALAKTGKAMRAVANNKELADVSGINSDKIILISFAFGSALAGIAGILVALDVDMTPTMGMNALMMGVVAMIVGGVGSIWGIALGALLLALAQNLGVWYISSQWQDAIAFAILLIFLLFKPEGFFGKKVKKAEI
ncbi:high-affinity branched-chain amino acid transport system permease protein livh [hydrocarbon metagenome]|uniref:High-affinity branched-chain amino acid transport system permease protein livh n=1 Tax=hydrocarbon metagenome TaxID=938273 RepID=A0A0W8FXS5_9ZZZZ